jgi:hypothetical protein
LPAAERCLCGDGSGLSTIVITIEDAARIVAVTINVDE